MLQNSTAQLISVQCKRNSPSSFVGLDLQVGTFTSDDSSCTVTDSVALESMLVPVVLLSMYAEHATASAAIAPIRR